MPFAAGPPIFLAVSDTVQNPGRSGIQSVVRSLSGAFGRGKKRFPPIYPVVWHNGRKHFRPLPPTLSLGLAAEPLRPPPGPPRDLFWHPGLWPVWAAMRGRAHEVPIHLHPRYRPLLRRAWLFMPELAYSGRTQLFLDYARRHRMRFSAVFHDAIPVQRPEFVPPGLPGSHAEYMRALAGADLILPNSENSAEGWHEFMAAEDLASPAVKVCTLASEIPSAPRETRPKEPDPSRPVRVLCVSTLEPRKNHFNFLDAYDKAVAARPDLPLELDLVGAPYVEAYHVTERVHEAINRHPGRVRWREKVENSLLRALYRECDFTVYPSLVEGFGLPVIESLWFAAPCVCANFGVMAENAAAGGCLTTDVRSPNALAAAILTLAENPGLRRKLSAEAVGRELKTWDDYSQEVVAAMRTHKRRPKNKS